MTEDRPKRTRSYRRRNNRCFYFAMDAYPSPTGERFEQYCGAVVSCWCRKDAAVRTTEQAHALAVSQLAEEGWEIAWVRETVVVGASRYSAPGPGFVEFREALETGFSAHYHVRRREVIGSTDLVSSDACSIHRHQRFVAALQSAGGGVSLREPDGETWGQLETPDGDPFVPLWADDSAVVPGSPRSEHVRVNVSLAELARGLLPFAVDADLWIGCGVEGVLVTAHPTLLARQLEPFADRT